MKYNLNTQIRAHIINKYIRVNFVLVFRITDYT